jgi:hypothetical protein
VVDAAQAIFLVAAEEQGSAAVRAGVLDDADLAGRGPEADQVLAEQAQAHWRAVGGGHLCGHERRDPVLAHEVAHEGSGTHLSESFVILLAQHVCRLD